MEKYIKLLNQTLDDIDKIDSDTPWQDFEPEWWLDMMEIRRLIQSKINKTN